MTKRELTDALPLIREALDACTGGSIEASQDKLVLTIHVDMKAMLDAATKHQKRNLRPPVSG
jgi:hypothetical protein